jgi:hypothetical protein
VPDIEQQEMEAVTLRHALRRPVAGRGGGWLASNRGAIVRPRPRDVLR